MLHRVLAAVLHFAGYMRCVAVWGCGFVTCLKFLDKTLQNVVLATGKNQIILLGIMYWLLKLPTEKSVICVVWLLSHSCKAHEKRIRTAFCFFWPHVTSQTQFLSRPTCYVMRLKSTAIITPITWSITTNQCKHSRTPTRPHQNQQFVSVSISRSVHQ